MYAFVYVYEILIIGSFSKTIHDLINKLYLKYFLKILSRPRNFLSIKVSYHARGSIMLSQSKYIKDVLVRTNISYANEASAIIPNNIKLSKHNTDAFSYPHQCRSVVGALQYVLPLIGLIYHLVWTKHVSSWDLPSTTHWTIVLRVLRYLMIKPIIISLCFFLMLITKPILEHIVILTGLVILMIEVTLLVSWRSNNKSLVARSKSILLNFCSYILSHLNYAFL